MNTNPHLHQLVKSLSGPEKRRLTLSFEKPQGVHARLYRAILKQDSYDESQLRNQFKGETFTKQLSVAKAYLYNHILKTLKSFHQGQTLSLELRDGLDRVELLWHRNLHAQSLPILRSTLKKATQMEVWLVCLECLEKEMVLVRQAGARSMEEELKALFFRQQEALDSIDQERTLRHLYNRSQVLRRKGMELRNDSDRQEWANISASPQFKAGPPSSFRQAILYYYLQIYASDFEERSAEVPAYYRKMLWIWEEKPIRIQHDKKRYFKALTNLIDVLIGEEDQDETDQLLEKVSNLKFSFPGMEDNRTYTLLHLRLKQYLNSKQYGAGIAYLSQDNSWEKTLKKNIGNTQLSLRHNILVLYFLGEEYSKARNQADLILRAKNDGLRQDVQYFARLLLLPIHYELDKHESLFDMIRSARRYFNRRDDLGDFERLFFRHFRLLDKAANRQEQKQVLRDFQQELGEFEGQLLGIEELKVWLKGKDLE